MLIYPYRVLAQGFSVQVWGTWGRRFKSAIPDIENKMSIPFLEIKKLAVEYDGKIALDDFSYSFHGGNCYAILGASGSGKTTAIKAMAGLLPNNAKQQGTILLNSETVDESSIQYLRGKKISYLLQDPISYFNPVYTLKQQLEHALYLKDRNVKKKESSILSDRALEWAGLPLASGRLYPHQTSGGMLNRAELAVSYIEKADVMLLDEPTSGLDGELEHSLLMALKDLAEENQSILIYITHSFSSLADVADELIILKDGRIQDSGKTVDVLQNPSSDYSKELISCSKLGVRNA